MQCAGFHEARHVTDPLSHGRTLFEYDGANAMEAQPVGAENSGRSRADNHGTEMIALHSGQPPALGRDPVLDRISRILQIRRKRIQHADVSVLARIDASFENAEGYVSAKLLVSGPLEFLFGVVIWKCYLELQGNKTLLREVRKFPSLRAAVSNRKIDGVRSKFRTFRSICTASNG
jgi:hypothetical protein